MYETTLERNLALFWAKVENLIIAKVLYISSTISRSSCIIAFETARTPITTSGIPENIPWFRETRLAGGSLAAEWLAARDEAMRLWS